MKIRLFLLLTSLVLAASIRSSVHQASVQSETKTVSPSRQTSHNLAAPEFHSENSRSANFRLTAARGLPVESFNETAAKLSVPDAVSPLAVASCDLDQDGVPDLVGGSSGDGLGMLVIYRGNADFMFPNSPAAQRHKAGGEFRDSPFLPLADPIMIEESPEFLAADDFDGDGYPDIVAASRTSTSLLFLKGTGSGKFEQPRQIKLNGRVTALVSGEIDRPDGLSDIALTVAAADRAELVLIKGSRNILTDSPRVLRLAANASSLTIGNLDRDSLADLAIVAGNELLIVQGAEQGSTPGTMVDTSTAIEHVALPFKSTSVVAADLSGDSTIDLALLADSGRVYFLQRSKTLPTNGRDRQRLKSRATESWHVDGTFDLKRPGEELSPQSDFGAANRLIAARISGSTTEDLLVLDQANRVRVLGNIKTRRRVTRNTSEYTERAWIDTRSSPVALLPMRLNSDAATDLVILRRGSPTPDVLLTLASTFTVTNTNDDGPGSLREAITAANSNTGLDTIDFAIGSGAQTITPTFDLPVITDPVTIDATTQPGFAGTPLIELRGDNTEGPGLLVTAGSSTIQGLVINRFIAPGIILVSGGNNIVRGNLIGTDLAGGTALGNGGGGVAVISSSGNTIGGTVASARNIISASGGSGVGLETGSGNTVQGNFIGTDITGAVDLGNGDRGVLVSDSASNMIGGTTAGALNLISGNGTEGILLLGSGSSSNLVQGNLIGTDVSGAAALANGFSGVGVQNAPGNTIGGASTSARNIISGNASDGVLVLDGGSSGNRIEGNFIGTDVSGAAALGNGQTGITLDILTAGTMILRNLVSGNATIGIELGNGAQNTVIQGNLIGVDLSGTASIANLIGVRIAESSNTTVGGTTAGLGNTISGNTQNGVEIVAATGTLLQGNLIGTNSSGTSAIPNGGFGVGIASTGNTVGGIVAGSRNIISGNTTGGVSIVASSNTVQGNYIGTNLTGTAALGNGGHGVAILLGSSTVVGGTTGAAANLISGNNGVGVRIGGSGNSLQGNLIGTNAAGTAAIANQSSGVVIDASANNTIGGLAAARNLISGNTGNGIQILNGANGNIIQSNFIGTNSAGTGSLANTGNGVTVSSGSLNMIGGTASGLANVIAFNSGSGVTVISGAGNAIRRNSIFSNGSFGIDLGADGPTANDAGDGDTGANNGQNFPVLTSVGGGPFTRIQGTINSTPNTTFVLEFFLNPACDPSGFGEGQTFLGTSNVTTNSSGNATFTVFLSTPSTIGQIITATATDPSGNTSEFSACMAISASDLCIRDDSVGNILQLNIQTGAYLFTACGKGITLTGTGQIKVESCKVTLTDKGPNPKSPDRDVMVLINTCTFVANGTIRTSSGKTFTISDSNISNSSCTCN